MVLIPLCKNNLNLPISHTNHYTFRVYSSSLLHVIITGNHLPFFKIFSNFVYFCSNFQIFCPFSMFFALFLKSCIMSFCSRIGSGFKKIKTTTTTALLISNTVVPHPYSHSTVFDHQSFAPLSYVPS